MAAVIPELEGKHIADRVHVDAIVKRTGRLQRVTAFTSVFAQIVLPDVVPSSRSISNINTDIESAVRT